MGTEKTSLAEKLLMIRNNKKISGIDVCKKLKKIAVCKLKPSYFTPSYYYSLEKNRIPTREYVIQYALALELDNKTINQLIAMCSRATLIKCERRIIQKYQLVDQTEINTCQTYAKEGTCKLNEDSYFDSDQIQKQSIG